TAGGSKDRPADPLGELFQSCHAGERVASGIQFRRPDADAEAPRNHSDDAASNAALAGQTDTVGEISRLVVQAAGGHDRVDLLGLPRTEDLLAAVQAVPFPSEKGEGAGQVDAIHAQRAVVKIA